MNDGLKAKHRKAIINVLAANERVAAAVLFGSRATATHTPASDVDIALFGEHLTLTDQAKLAAAMDELPMAQQVDLLLYETVDSPALREHIERHGVEWYRRPRGMAEAIIGQVPMDWETTTLGAVCERGGGNIQTGPFGSQLHASDYVSAGIPSVMPQNIGDNRIREDSIKRIKPNDAKRLSRYLLREGDIVYSRRGDVERRALVRRDEAGWLCGTGCLRVRLGEGEADPHFASYFLAHPRVREWIVRHAHGATMANLNTSILGACPFVVPPINEQRTIAHILGTLDDKIDLNRRMNTTLEATARALFKDWFVDFGPTRAKTAGHKPYLAPEIWHLFPDTLDSEGKPEGWEIKPLTEFFSIIGGGTPKTSNADYWAGPIPWFSVADTPAAGSVFVTATEKSITNAGLDGSSARLIPKGTTIISARGTVGNLAIAGCEMAFNQSCYGLQGAAPVGNYATYLIAQNMVHQLQAIAHGSVFSTITRQTFASLSLPMPSPGILEYFEHAVSPLFDKIFTNVEQSRTLTQTRDLLLPRLMSGDIRLVEVE